MSIDIIVPALGESISEATVTRWLKPLGTKVIADEPVIELETDKATLEIPAPATGILAEILVDEGSTTSVASLLGRITQDDQPIVSAPTQVTTATSAPPTSPQLHTPAQTQTLSPQTLSPEVPLSPAVRKMVEDNQLSPTLIPSSGKDSRLTKGDVLNYLEQKQNSLSVQPSVPSSIPMKPTKPSPTSTRPRAAQEERVRMTRLRQRIAERLKLAQNTSAMLTTFNEVDMTAIMEMRSQYKESFEKKYHVRLGFMSFFIKACVTSLKEIPEVNAEIDDDDIIYKDYYNIGVAVGSPKGLIVPVVHDADQLSFAQIEQKITELGEKARDGKISIDELSGGSFTISNGGIYGSLMSTPILNPPQSAILGMHKIQQRPIVVDGKIEARPMMYLALSYDHRLIDGREAVTFLVRVKERIEDPKRMVINL